ncbi:MAG: type II toxin-antitoxin system RelE/ParE family toxin [Defluviitaleaceae bacterium]|nr:type II toxin-antitoxin system RelE/ParE family toxin [Defluviitaleaceae bacterium]
MYEVKYSSASARYFKKMVDKKLKTAFKTAIDEISENPYIGSQKSGDLNGIYGYDVKYAKTNYEIAYRIYEEENNYVVVILAGTRENFYDDLKRIVT